MPIELHDKEAVDHVFFTCCAIHNHLHSFDGRDRWESGVSWGHEDGQFADDGEHWGLPCIMERDGDTWRKRHVREDEDFSQIGRLFFSSDVDVVYGGIEQQQQGVIDVTQLVALHTEKEASFLKLQSDLVKNYTIRLEANSVYWLRSGTAPRSGSQ